MKIIQKIVTILILATFLTNITSCVFLKIKLFPPGLLKKIDDEDSKDSAQRQEKKDKEKDE